MKKFVKFCLLFLAPILVYYACNEYYCRTATSFALKKKYLEGNLGSIEVLFLGSSHTLNGVNPKLISKKVFNLAFGGQPISIDYYLLNKYINQMPHLKTVFIEVSPHRFYYDFDTTDWNGYIYSILYDINYKVKLLSLSNYSFLFSNFEFYRSKIIDYYNPYSPKYIINDCGYIENNFEGEFLKLKFDSLKIYKSFQMKHDFSDKNKIRLNDSFLEKLILRCKNKGVKVVFLSTPLYNNYLKNIPIKTKKEVGKLVDKYISEFGIIEFDYSGSKKFNRYDFRDEDHLNPNGAKKFSKILDSIINISR